MDQLPFLFLPQRSFCYDSLKLVSMSLEPDSSTSMPIINKFGLFQSIVYNLKLQLVSFYYFILFLFYFFSFITCLQAQLFHLPLNLFYWRDFVEGFLFDLSFSFLAIQIVLLPLLTSSFISCIAFLIFIHLFMYTIGNSFYSLNILKPFF